MIYKFGFMILTSVLTVPSFSLASTQVNVTSPGPVDFASLCSSGIEGTLLGSIGTKKTLFNLVCLDSNRMALGISYGFPDTTTIITLSTSIIDDDGSLVLSLDPLDPPSRKGVTSGSPEIYVRLDVEALKQGYLKGVYLGGNDIRPQPLSAQMSKKLPAVSSLKSLDVDSRSAQGTYHVKFSSGASLDFWFDIVAGVPVVTLYIGKGQHLIDGPVWNAKSGFEVANVFGDFTAGGFDNLVQMRGSLKKAGELEVYLIDPKNGAQGPATATRE